MTHSITWVVNFCSQNCLEGKNNFINASWYKYSDANDLFNFAGHDKEDVKLISDYFEKQSYKELLLRFWHNDDIINIEKFNIDPPPRKGIRMTSKWRISLAAATAVAALVAPMTLNAANAAPIEIQMWTHNGGNATELADITQTVKDFNASQKTYKNIS